MREGVSAGDGRDGGIKLDSAPTPSTPFRLEGFASWPSCLSLDFEMVHA